MSVFGGLILTNKGRNLLIKGQLGVVINYTRIGIGDGELSGSSVLDLTVLKHEVKTLSITKLKALTGGRFVVGSTFTNNDITSGFYYRELGLFAQDPDLGEILYCYANAGTLAEYITTGGGADLIEKAIDIEIIIRNAASVSATIDNSLIYASAQELTNEINSLAGAGRTTETVKGNADNIAIANTNVANLTTSVATKLATKETPTGAQTKANTAETNAKSYADTKVAALVNSSPATLDTLKELSDALGADANYAATTAILIGTKETPAGAQSKVNSLGGTGRTTETVKQNADDIVTLGESLTSHSADNTQQLELKADKIIDDDTTSTRYEMGINNGLLYYRVVV